MRPPMLPTLRLIRPVAAVLALVELFQPVLLLVELRFAITPALDALTLQISTVLRMLVAVGALVNDQSGGRSTDTCADPLHAYACAQHRPMRHAAEQ